MGDWGGRGPGRGGPGAGGGRSPRARSGGAGAARSALLPLLGGQRRSPAGGRRSPPRTPSAHLQPPLAPARASPSCPAAAMRRRTAWGAAPCARLRLGAGKAAARPRGSPGELGAGREGIEGRGDPGGRGWTGGGRRRDSDSWGRSGAAVPRSARGWLRALHLCECTSPLRGVKAVCALIRCAATLSVHPDLCVVAVPLYVALCGHLRVPGASVLTCAVAFVGVAGGEG